MESEPRTAAAYVTYIRDRVVDTAPVADNGRLRRLTRYFPVMVAVAVLTGVAVVAAHAWPAYTEPMWLAVPVHLVGVPFIVCGAALWVQRTGDYLGPVCVLFGAIWYIGDLQSYRQEIVYAIGFSLYFLNVVALAHLALMVPTGRLVGPAERIVVALLYLEVPTTQFLRYLDIRDHVDRGGFGFVNGAYSPWARLSTAIGLPLAAAAAWLTIAHYRQAKTVRRRSFGLFWTGAAAAGVAATAAVALEASSAVLPQQLSVLGYALALMAAAIGLLLGTVNVASPTREAWRKLTGDVVDIEQALAAAVGDPELKLYVRRGDRWERAGAGVGGEPPVGAGGEPPVGVAEAHTELRRGERAVALIVHDRELAYQRSLLHAVTAMTIGAIVRQQLAESRDEAVLDGQHAERARIHRDLHDDAQHPLANMVLRLSDITGQLTDDAVRRQLGEVAQEAAALQSRLAQIVDNVYPAVLRHDGLAAAVRARLRTVEPERHGLTVTLDLRSPPRRWPQRVELAAYFIVSEALQNAVKHSAGSIVRISIAEEAGIVRVSIDDDGRGWPTETRPGGRGIRNLVARVELLRGTLERTPSPLGGARLAAVIPSRADDRQAQA